MLATALQRLIDQNLTTARELGELAGVSPSTVYRWINGESQPDFHAVRLMLRHLKNHKAQLELLSVFTAGTAWQLIYADHELDVNNDGRVDASDALDACIRTVEAAAGTLKNIRNNAKPGGTLSAEDTMEVLAQLNDVAQYCNVTQRVLVKIGEKRRTARVRLAE